MPTTTNTPGWKPLTLLVCAALAWVAPAFAQCDPGFAPLGSLSAEGVDGTVRAMAVFDDGAGPALYVGGDFSAAGGAPASNIARWDGSAWSAVGGGTNGTVLTLTVFDDGSGPALYAGGWFTTAGRAAANGVARWDGSAWGALGEGVAAPTGTPPVINLLAHDDGSGPALYAAGGFETAGGQPARFIARWDGAAWSPVGPGTADGALVSALAAFDDGTGPALYAGGLLGSLGGASVASIARWDGVAWSGLPEYVGFRWYTALRAWGGGPGGAALYAGFDDAVVAWDGEAWSTIGATAQPVYALTPHDDGTGEALYAGGVFTQVNGIDAPGVVRWDGAAWASVGGGLGLFGGGAGEAFALQAFDDGSGPALFIAGRFDTAGAMAGSGGVLATNIVRWGCEPACPADCDDDGDLTVFDFFCFQNAFDAGEPYGDFDRDGALTIFDFLAFQNAFAAGCG
ncbi:MAG: GC-type dockerin domain-anchored protein [Phycisphaerales bacterium]